MVHVLGRQYSGQARARTLKLYALATLPHALNDGRTKVSCVASGVWRELLRLTQ